MKDFRSPLLHSKHRIVGDEPDIKYLVGLFDGACAGGTCGGGIYLCIWVSHLFHFNMGCGMGSNNHVELLTLWGLTSIAHSMGFPLLEIFGDFMSIVD